MAFSVIYGDALTYVGDAVLNSLGTEGSSYGKLCKKIIAGINRPSVTRMINSLHDMQYGKIVETDGGDLGCEHVIHIVTPIRKNDDAKCSELRKAYKSVVDCAIERGYKTIGLPFIGTGANGYANAEVYNVITDVLSEISEREEKSGEEIINATVIGYLRRSPQPSRNFERRRRLINEAYIEMTDQCFGDIIECDDDCIDFPSKKTKNKKSYAYYAEELAEMPSQADLIYDIVQFMADVNPDEMFTPNYPPNSGGYFRQYDFVEDYCAQKNLNRKRVLKEYDCRKRQKISTQYTISKLDVYRFTVLLNLNKSEFVTFMSLCEHMPSPNSKLDLFFMNYMDGMFGPIGKQRTLYDMDKLFGLQDGIQFTIAGTESAARALKNCIK